MLLTKRGPKGKVLLFLNDFPLMMLLEPERNLHGTLYRGNA